MSGSRQGSTEGTFLPIEWIVIGVLAGLLMFTSLILFRSARETLRLSDELTRAHQTIDTFNSTITNCSEFKDQVMRFEEILDYYHSEVND